MMIVRPSATALEQIQSAARCRRGSGFIVAIVHLKVLGYV